MASYPLFSLYRTLNCDPKYGHIPNYEEDMKLWTREYDTKFDPFMEA